MLSRPFEPAQLLALVQPNESERHYLVSYWLVKDGGKDQTNS